MGALTDDIIDFTAQPASAQACQALCAKHQDCDFFSFNDQGVGDEKYAVFRDMCFLHKALTCSGTAYSTYHGIIAGPKVCPEGVTVPEPKIAPDSILCLSDKEHKMPGGMVMLNSEMSPDPCADCKAFPCEIKSKKSGDTSGGGHDDHGDHDGDDHSKDKEDAASVSGSRLLSQSKV